MACEVCHKVYMPNDDNIDVKPHLCMKCGLSFSLKIQLKRHALLHADEAPYTCVNCVRTSDDKSKTYNFRLGNKTEYICDICQKSFNNKRLLLRHSIQHTFDKISDTEENENQKVNKKPESIQKRKYSRKSYDKKELLSCGLCDRKFLTWLALEKHTLTHNTSKSEKTLFCKFCSKGFIYQGSLDKHIKKGNCNNSLSKPELSSNNKVPEDDKKHLCNICGKTFARKSSLEGHEFSHIVDKVTSDEEKDCSDTEENDKHASDLKVPKKYNFEKSYTCANCNFVCFSKLTLEKHSRNHHNQNEVTSSVTVVQSEQSSEDSLSKPKWEKQRHQRSKNLICEICGRKFAGEICFKKHILKHELDKNNESPIKATKIKRTKPVKELICEYCNEVFSGKRSAYVKHIHAHTPEVCGICDARFVDRHSLREHCKIHVGTEEGRMFMQCSQKALDAKQVVVQQEPKVEYIYLVIR